MYTICTAARCLLSGLLFLLVAVTPGVAQEYATTVVSSLNTTDTANAVDASRSTAAVLMPSLVDGDAYLRLGFAQSIAKGEEGGLRIRPGQPLDAAALAALTIHTYYRANGTTTAQESLPVSSLVDLNTLNADTSTVKFTASLPYNEVELEADDVVNARYTIELYFAYGDVAPLAVTLVAFQGQATAAGVSLSWKTASEDAAAYFEVQRAPGDAPTRFVTLGQVAAAGTSAQAHAYAFLAPPSPLAYYRLRQVDSNGQQAFSPTIVVPASDQPASLSVYPSPASEDLTVTGPAGDRLAILTEQGQQVLRLELPASAQQLSVHDLPAGVYILRDLTSGRSLEFTKVDE